MKIKKSWISLALLTPVLALGQGNPFLGGADVGGGKPWESFKLNPKTKVKLDFHNSGIDAILSMYQKLSGVTIVKDPNLTKGITLTSAKPVSLGEAFQILQATLSLQGYEIGKDSNLLIIRPKPKNGGNPWGGGNQFPAFDPSMLTGGNDQPPQLKVYPIKYANASQLARVLNDVFQSSGAGGFPGFGGRPGGGGFTFPGGGGNRGGAGGFNPAQLFSRMGQQQTPQVRASSDDFSNSVIVNAPRDQQTQVAELINQLDKITDEPQQTKVFPLEFAASDDLQPVVQNLLNANVPRGKGGATTQQSQGPGAFFSAIRGSVSGSGQATSDPRTNSLIVTATADNIKLIDKVVKELDSKIDLQPTTFVFPLSNAQSDDIAGLLNQAFGQRQGTGTNRGGTNNRNTNSSANRNNNNNNANRNRNNQGGGLGGENIDPNRADANAIPIDIDPNSEDGQLMTSIGVAQGFGGGFFGGGQQGQRRNTNGQSSTARDPNGRVVNANDLTGQVTTISDPNTNSIIVVTSPENAELIRKILDQLDRIPEQVMIQTIITEASLDAQDKLGVEWKFAQSKFLGNSSTTSNGNTNFGLQNSSTSSTPLTGFSYTITGGNLSVFLNALQQDQKFQILSTPRIFTSNNVQAEINISQRVPYIVSSRQDVNGNFTYNYSFEDVGIVLTVTPHVTKDGYVTMDVSQTANDLQGYTTFNAPIINQRTAETTVSVKDGETIVLGGIIRTTVSSTVSKVPLLGDIPLLGKLFQNKSKEKQKTELLVFLTPRIVRDPAEAKKLREDTQKELSPETTKGLDNVLKPPTGAVPPAGKGDKKTGGN